MDRKQDDRYADPRTDCAILRGSFSISGIYDDKTCDDLKAQFARAIEGMSRESPVLNGGLCHTEVKFVIVVVDVRQENHTVLQRPRNPEVTTAVSHRDVIEDVRLIAEIIDLDLSIV